MLSFIFFPCHRLIYPNFRNWLLWPFPAFFQVADIRFGFFRVVNPWLNIFYIYVWKFDTFMRINIHIYTRYNRTKDNFISSLWTFLYFYILIITFFSAHHCQNILLISVSISCFLNYLYILTSFSHNIFKINTFYNLNIKHFSVIVHF